MLESQKLLSQRLSRMGWCWIGLALLFSGTAFLLPKDLTPSWIDKEGVYILSLFFIFLGFYCLGGVWRRRHFM